MPEAHEKILVHSLRLLCLLQLQVWEEEMSAGSRTPVLVEPPHLKLIRESGRRPVPDNNHSARTKRRQMLKNYWLLIPWPAFCESMQDDWPVLNKKRRKTSLR